MLNHSPWLNFERAEWPGLKTDLNCELAIVGGGISGVATLYYLLTSTQKNVVLLEKNRIASGTTGHNAGLAVVHIEKSMTELVQMLGKEATQALYGELDEAWDELHAIHDEIGLKDNLLSFPYAANGFNSLPQFVEFVKATLIRTECSRGQTQWRYLVSGELKAEIPEELSTVIEYVPHEEVLAVLKTIDTSYIATTMRIPPFPGKRMNSAKFCYQVLDYLKSKFAHRFSLYEQTYIARIDLYKNHVLLKHAHGEVNCDEVILCTNAYKDFSIWENDKPVTKLQDSITPRIGYLAAFRGDSSERYALGFLNQQEAFNEIPFWYFSHAPHPNHNPEHACVIGGPEFDLEGSYSQEWVEAKGVLSLNLITHFLKKTFKQAPTAFPFFWHGWMGYTPDGLRWVGPDADHPRLWYNLACNGIGIVHAIAGGKKIATLMGRSC